MISLIAAIGENNALGLQGKLPWHLPADFSWFKKTTMQRPMIMGRKTFESLPGLLPGRLHIVISRTPQENQEHVLWVSSLQAAVAAAQACENYRNDEIMIIGGGEIYTQAITFVDRMYLTEVAASPKADAFFPVFDKAQWRVAVVAEYAATDKQPAFVIRQYDGV
jgi:dihydrofolate reductase